MDATNTNLGELHANQVTLDSDGVFVKGKFNDVMHTLGDLDSKCIV